MSRFHDHSDSFEQFLKETTESFCMKPGAKVWKSIYNNIHPRKKWPAFSTNVILLFGLLFLQVPGKLKVVDLHVESTKNKETAIQKDQSENEYESEIRNYTKFTEIKTIKINSDIDAEVVSDHIYSETKQSIFDGKNETEKVVMMTEIDQIDKNKYTVIPRLNPQVKNYNLDVKSYTSKTNSNNQKQGKDYLFQLYATPGFGFSQAVESEQNTNGSITGINTSSTGALGENNATSKTTLNLEAGGAVLMNVSRIVRLKAGMQLNYTHIDENTSSDNSGTSLNNPVVAYNTNSQMFQREKSSTYNAELYQISVPIGTEIEITGNDRFRWYAGATIQPSFLMNAESQDEISITNRDALFGLRKWNLNTSVETYVSYKLKNGVILNLGPQFRYQWLSTYNQPLMSGMDRLYNIGLKLGVSRNF